jgi:hypothetical protein
LTGLLPRRNRAGSEPGSKFAGFVPVKRGTARGGIPAAAIFCRPLQRTIIQHSRAEDDTLKTRIAGLGDRLTLDPPGIAVAVSDLFKDLDSAFAD